MSAGKVDVLALIDLQIAVGSAALEEARHEKAANLPDVELRIGTNVRRLREARAALAVVFSKSEAAWQTIANLVAADQIDAKYSDVYLDLRAALAWVQP